MSQQPTRTPWGSLADKQALAATVRRNGDGNFAAAVNGVGAPKEPGYKRRIALTFDDGPSAKTTPKVLDILQKHGIQATFFIHGEQVRGSVEVGLLNRMYSEGHTVANHAETHDNFKTHPERAAPSVAKTHGRIQAVLKDRAQFFRFPGGNASPESIRAVEAQGYAVVGWHVDSADWCYASNTGGPGVCTVGQYKWMDEAYRSDMTAFVLAQLHKTGGGILLFHDNRQYTADALNSLLVAIKGEGFTFTPLDDADTFPTLNAWAANLTPDRIG